MIDAREIPPVNDSERLARFIVNSNEYRKQDDSVKPQLFMPYKRVELSVNRHRDCTEQEIWHVARRVASVRNRRLLGRADIEAGACRIEPLKVVASPILPENPNHADVIGYPPKKEDQKSLALKLAAAATERLPPPAEIA